MGQDILSKLHRLFSGTIDTVKVTYRSSKSKETMKFEMLGHKIEKENGTIRIIDDTETRFFTPKTVIIEKSMVSSVTYGRDKSDDSGIHCRKLAVNQKDKSRIEMETVAFG